MGRLHKYIPVITKIEKWAGISNIQMIRVTLIHVLASGAVCFVECQCVSFPLDAQTVSCKYCAHGGFPYSLVLEFCIAHGCICRASAILRKAACDCDGPVN